jgi:hypothetical protein
MALSIEEIKLTILQLLRQAPKPQKKRPGDEPGPTFDIGAAEKPMLGVRVNISRYVGESFPGWVECTLVDAFGYDHVFVEKVPVVTKAHLDAASSCPQLGVIACVVLGISQSDDGRRLAHIDTQSVQSLAGKRRFDVFPEQLVADLSSLGLVSTKIWKDVELYEHGLKDFASLTPLERDWFVIKDLDIFYEMEGGEDYFLSGNDTFQLMWLQDVLRRIGDTVSAQIISELRSMNESQRLEMKPLCDRYYGHRHQRWQLLKRHLESNGITIDESP